MPPRTLIGGGRAMGRGAEPPAPPAPRAPRPQKARPPRTHALSVLLWALLALAGYSGSAAAEGAARLAPRQVANKPNNTVDCPVFRFGGSSPAVPVFSTPCGGSSAKTTVAMLSDVRRVVAPGSALADCKLENSKFQFSDDDGNGWLSAWTGTSGDVSSWGDLDGMFSISGGTDLQIDQGKCQSNDLSFATNVMARRLLRVQLNCNNNQFVGWLHFRWYPSNMAGTPPSELASMPCTQPSTQAYNWLTGDAFPAVSSTTRASTTVLETSSTTLRVTSTTPRTSTTVAVTSTRATTATPVVQADAATSTSVRATSTTARTSTTVRLSSTSTAEDPTTTTRPLSTAAAASPAPTIATGVDENGCNLFPPGLTPPYAGNLLDSFVNGSFRYVVVSKNVPRRTMTVLLGDDASLEACVATLQPKRNKTDCDWTYMLIGSWQQLRGCGWKTGIEADGYIPMTNRLRARWNDSFPGPLNSWRVQNSSLSWAIEVRLPTTVQLQTDIKVVEDSGIKNFNLTGFFFLQGEDGSRNLVLDYQMWSRWPNNLTYDIISSLPFTPGGPLRTLEMQGPNLDLCGPPPYTTESQCWQFGSILIPLGDVCNVTGPYTFAFDTNCFPNSATSDCKGTKLFANAFIDGIDLCAGLMSTAGNVTGTLTVDKPQGYFFGDTVLLNATFESPDVPLYETRLMSFDAIIRKWKPDPVSVYTLQGGNGLFGRNANFSVVLDGLASPYSVLMHLTPNMMPKFEDGGFLTIEDFDTADNDFTFTLRFRVFFDPVSAGRTGLRRRSAARRRVYRDASLHFGRRQGGAIGSIREIAVGARSSMQVPNVTQALQTAPQMVPNGTVAAPPPQQQAAAAGTPVWAIVVGVLGGLLLLGGCCGGVAYLVIRRRDRKRKEAMGYSEKDPLVRSAAAYGGSDMLSPYAYAQAVGEKTGRPRSRASFSAPTGYVPTYTPPSAGGYSALELPVPPVTGAGGGGEMTWSGLGGDFVSRHASASWGTPADAVDVSGMFGAPAGAPSSSAPQVSTSADTVVDVSGMFGAQPPQPRASADWGGDRSASRSSGRSKRERH